MDNYIVNVEPKGNKPKVITAQANGIHINFVKTNKGVQPISRYIPGATVYSHEELYIPKAIYAEMVIQVHGVFSERARAAAKLSASGPVQLVLFK